MARAFVNAFAVPDWSVRASFGEEHRTRSGTTGSCERDDGTCDELGAEHEDVVGDVEVP